MGIICFALNVAIFDLPSSLIGTGFQLFFHETIDMFLVGTIITLITTILFETHNVNELSNRIQSGFYEWKLFLIFPQEFIYNGVATAFHFIASLSWLIKVQQIAGGWGPGIARVVQSTANPTAMYTASTVRPPNYQDEAHYIQLCFITLGLRINNCRSLRCKYIFRFEEIIISFNWQKAT